VQDVIRRIKPFAAGVSMGVIATSLALLAAALAADQELSASSGQQAGEALVALAVWAWRNLGYSLPCFMALLVLYSHSLERLRAALAESASPETVRQAEHLTDVWTSLFFGVGVIWTAIGMRGALVEALSDGGAGGVEVLERMVDGGILLALSTTIFGGVGGYLMRAWKTLAVGAELARYEERERGRDLAALRASLSAIERRVCGQDDGGPEVPGDGRGGDERS
jgi:hypothetical protein